MLRVSDRCSPVRSGTIRHCQQATIQHSREAYRWLLATTTRASGSTNNGTADDIDAKNVLPEDMERAILAVDY